MKSYLDGYYERFTHCSIFLFIWTETRLEMLLVWLRLHGLFRAEFINKLVLYFESLKRCLVTLDGLLVFAVI